jgi:hypothetical protein
MGYVGGKLTQFFGRRPQAETKRALVAMCARGTDRMHEVAAMNTPVRTGNLRTAWYQTPVRPTTNVRGQSGVEASVRNDTEYAPYVEYGTGKWGPKHAPYEIRPKDPDGVLAWRDPHTGKWIRRKKVMHPGSPGNHMISIAAHVVEAEFGGGMMRGPLDDWARRVEDAAS